jgi:hypothetical protein
MERVIEVYIEGCCEADADKIISSLTPDCAHYFPPGMYDGPWVGADLIARKWCTAVADLGSYWTIDSLIVSPDANHAAGEWTHFKTKQGTVLRGMEWYEFGGQNGLISEIRAYYASPQASDLDRLELGGFDYQGRGFELAPPPGARD